MLWPGFKPVLHPIHPDMPPSTFSSDAPIHVFLECLESVIAVLLKISLDCTPKELNKIELTVKFWKKDAKMALRPLG
jgi:hypothetical protein